MNLVASLDLGFIMLYNKNRKSLVQQTLYVVNKNIEVGKLFFQDSNAAISCWGETERRPGALR
jgi:uncharacterized cupredoxin-like copper-binding protein